MFTLLMFVIRLFLAIFTEISFYRFIESQYYEISRRSLFQRSLSLSILHPMNCEVYIVIKAIIKKFKMTNPDEWLATLKQGKCLDEKNLRLLCE